MQVKGGYMFEISPNLDTLVVLGVDDEGISFVVELNDVNNNQVFQENRYLKFDVPLIDIAIDK